MRLSKYSWLAETSFSSIDHPIYAHCSFRQISTFFLHENFRFFFIGWIFDRIYRIAINMHALTYLCQTVVYSRIQRNSCQRRKAAHASRPLSFRLIFIRNSIIVFFLRQFQFTHTHTKQNRNPFDRFRIYIVATIKKNRIACSSKNAKFVLPSPKWCGDHKNA